MNTNDQEAVNDDDDDDDENEYLLLPIVLKYRKELCKRYYPIINNYNTKNYFDYELTNNGELAAFIAYATAFPHYFLCLIDTYDTLSSGLLNFIIVSLTLYELGYTPIGIRLDSGDLAYLSMQCATIFHSMSIDYPFFNELSIVASNDINEEVLHSLNKQQHAITIFGIGTNLVTCQAQPALGCVYKLVEISGKPRMKLSQEMNKVLIPCKKKVYRLYGKDSRPILDLLCMEQEPDPIPHTKIMCRHPFVSRKRVVVVPTIVERLDYLIYDHGTLVQPNINRTIQEARTHVLQDLNNFRSDIIRYMNPTPYKVSVSETLYDFFNNLWQSEIPLIELS